MRNHTHDDFKEDLQRDRKNQGHRDLKRTDRKEWKLQATGKLQYGDDTTATYSESIK